MSLTLSSCGGGGGGSGSANQSSAVFTDSETVQAGLNTLSMTFADGTLTASFSFENCDECYETISLVRTRGGTDSVTTSSESTTVTSLSKDYEFVDYLNSTFKLKACVSTTCLETETPIEITMSSSDLDAYYGLADLTVSQLTGTFTYSIGSCTDCYSKFNLFYRGDTLVNTVTDSSARAIHLGTDTNIIDLHGVENSTDSSYSIEGCNSDVCYRYGTATDAGAEELIVGLVPVSTTLDDIGAGGDKERQMDLSKDGSTVVVGATRMNSGEGVVYVYRLGSSGWILEETLEASNKGDEDNFGASVAVKEDGSLIVVGAEGEDSNLTGINNAGADNDNAVNSGAAYVFRKTGESWAQEAYIKADNPGGDGDGTAAGDAVPSVHTLNASSGGSGGDRFGYSVGLSSNGLYFAVGSVSDDSESEGIFSSQQTDNDEEGVGAVHVYFYNGSSWALQAYVKPSWNGEGSNASDSNNASNMEFYGTSFGSSIDIDDDGSTMIIGAEREDSGSTGVIDSISFTGTGTKYGVVLPMFLIE